MLEGTKRLFPTDYEKFKNAMIDAAETDDLPIFLQLEDLKDFTLKDIQDMFCEFEQDTGLEIEGHVFLEDNKKNLIFVISVDHPEENNNLLQ